MSKLARHVRVAISLALAVLPSLAVLTSPPAHSPSPGSGLPLPRPAGLLVSQRTFSYPPTTAQCVAKSHQACYSPWQLQAAYNLHPLFSGGLTGRGETIAIVDSFGSPTIRTDLARFDADFGLPPPPSFKIIAPAGKIPVYDPSGTDRIAWAEETTLDVELAHSMAPEANILLVETPVDETVGRAGFPQIVRAENYVIDHKMADVISQSFGAAEQTFPGGQAIRGLRSAFFKARSRGVTVLASSGDQGPTSQRNVNGDLFPRRVTVWPASDPLVTAVGGTQLHLNPSGTRTARDNAWNDFPDGGGVSAGGGGLSTVFKRPLYQDSVSSVTAQHRGVPDVSLSADPRGGALIYTSFAGLPAGYRTIGGTSEAAPLLAGIVAVANQANGADLGFLNPKLYRIGSGTPVLPDITKGNTTVVFSGSSKPITVTGYRAIPGYDLATGLGTVDATKLVKALTGLTFPTRHHHHRRRR